MSSNYADQFKIAVNAENRQFVENPYVPGTCKPCDVAEFHLVKGAHGCMPVKEMRVVWDADYLKKTMFKPALIGAGCTLHKKTN